MSVLSKIKNQKELSAYIAPENRIKELKSELSDIIFEKETFFLCGTKVQKTYWSQNVWSEVCLAPVDSIGKTAKLLKEKKVKWTHFSLEKHRRGELVLEQLARPKKQKIKFPAPILEEDIGAFSFFDEKNVLFSIKTRERVPNGEYLFEEPSFAMPSEAYLKLLEALTRLGRYPGADDFCVDIGSSPGSWTQALLSLGCKVFSVDKAPLEIDPRPNLDFQKRDAFRVDPKEVKNPTWIFSDIICYPDKLLELALKWKDAHPRAFFVFTIKFQKEWDPEVVKAFERIPNSTVLHLFNNKHELCWLSTKSA